MSLVHNEKCIFPLESEIAAVLFLHCHTFSRECFTNLKEVLKHLNILLMTLALPVTSHSKILLVLNTCLIGSFWLQYVQYKWDQLAVKIPNSC